MIIPVGYHDFTGRLEKLVVPCKQTIRCKSQHLTNLFNKARCAVRRESHDFVFIAVMREAEKLGECRVERPA